MARKSKLQTAEETRQIAIEKFQRDENGLLKNIEYTFQEDGSVDWKAMIPKKYIVFNEEWFERNNQNIPTGETLADVDKPEDYEEKQLVVLLAGIKEVAKIRGLVSATKRICESGQTRAVVSCKVEFIPNYESNFNYIYEEVANATIYNTNNFMHFFLETIASNRAFVRAVRNALRIDIVGSDELSTAKYATRNQGAATGVESWRALAEICSKKEVNIGKDSAGKNVKHTLDSFEKFQAFLLNKGVELAKEWSTWKDIPPEKVFTFLSQLKNI